MLVLTRAENESLTLLDGEGHTLAEFTIVRVGQGRVRVGLKAPASIKIFRNEILPSVRQESPPLRKAA